jgi:hypothetical protein
VSIADPHFQPFVGAQYPTQQRFSGRLLILGESHYLLAPKKDDTPDFTKRILRDVMANHMMPGWRTPYFRNLFYVLTNNTSRAVTQQEWENVWNCVAFYNYIQSPRLEGPRIRPTYGEWLDAFEPFRTVLSELKPQLILITGTQLLGHVGKMEGARQSANRPGILLPTGNDEWAYTRCIYHPSSVRFLGRRKECREIVEELLRRIPTAS